MLNYSVGYFLSEYWRYNAKLYSDKLIPLLDFMLNNSFNTNGTLDEKSQKLSGAFFEIINKYQNPQDLSTESMRELLSEHGYSYITDLINPSVSDLAVVIHLIVLIHFLKDSRKGLETVLNIFTIVEEPSDLQIIEWFQESPVAEENTFRIISNIDVNKVSLDFFQVFNVFIKNYVYPTLREFRVKCNLLPEAVIVPLIQVEITYTAHSEI